MKRLPGDRSVGADAYSCIESFLLSLSSSVGTSVLNNGLMRLISIPKERGLAAGKP